jgi:uncharacterized protein
VKLPQVVSPAECQLGEGWDADTFELGESEITLWRVPGYVGGEPGQPVARDVVGAMAPMSSAPLPGDLPPHWRVDFWVDDVDAIAGKAAALGGRVVVLPVGRTAVLADPQGAVFSVSRVSPVA